MAVLTSELTGVKTLAGLGFRGYLAGSNLGEKSNNHLAGECVEIMVESFLGVVGRNGMFDLGDNFASVKLGGHFDGGDAGDSLLLEKSPFYRESASIVRQERGVEINSHYLGKFKPNWGKKKAVAGNNNKVGWREVLGDNREVSGGEDW